MVSHFTPQAVRIKWIDIFAAGMLAVFLFSAHFSLLEQNIRFAAMFGSLFAMVIASLNNAAHIFTGKGFMYVLIVLCAAFAIYTHNESVPTLTEYASQKRLYFYFVFLACGLIFPLGLCRQKSMEMAIWMLVGISVIFAILSFFGGDTGNIRRSAIGLNPTLLSKLVFFPALYLLIRGGSIFKHKILFISAVLGVFGCIASGSRGAILAFLLCVALYGGSTLRIKDIFKFGVLGLMFLGLALLALSYAPDEISSRFTLSALEGQYNEGSRLFLYDFSWNLFLNNLDGIGMGNMSAYFWIYAPHNLILEALLDLGWLHSILYIFLLVMSFIIAVRSFHSPNINYRFICGWYIFMFMNSMIGGEMSFPSIMLYIPMGLLWLFPSNVVQKKTTPMNVALNSPMAV